jgi:hypothetical protein
MNKISGKLWFWEISLLVILLVILSSCSGESQEVQMETEPPIESTVIPPTKEKTPTPNPTETPSPTNTPTATAIPAPTNTPTPDFSATAAVEATQQAGLDFQSISSELEMIGYQPESGQIGWIQGDTEMIYVDFYDGYLYTPFAEDLLAEDFIMKTDITWASTSGLAGCGFLFRSEKDFEKGAQYEFVAIRLSGLPVWNIIHSSDGEFQKNVSGVVAASAIDQEQGSTNTFHLIAEEGKFTLFINDQRIGSYYDYANSRLEGYFAFTGLQESGETTCFFDNTWIWMLD